MIFILNSELLFASAHNGKITCKPDAENPLIIQEAQKLKANITAVKKYVFLAKDNEKIDVRSLKALLVDLSQRMDTLTNHADFLLHLAVRPKLINQIKWICDFPTPFLSSSIRNAASHLLSVMNLDLDAMDVSDDSDSKSDCDDWVFIE